MSDKPRTRARPIYRVVPIGLWYDDAFRSLPPPSAPNASYLFLHLTTSPRSTPFPGLFVVSFAEIAEDFGWPLADTMREVEAMIAAGLARYDRLRRLIFLPSLMASNAPSSPNGAKSWGYALRDLPRCALADEARQAAERFLRTVGRPSDSEDGAAFLLAFREGCGEGSAQGFAQALGQDVAKPWAKAGSNHGPTPAHQDSDPEANSEPKRPARARTPAYAREGAHASASEAGGRADESSSGEPEPVDRPRTVHGQPADTQDHDLDPDHDPDRRASATATHDTAPAEGDQDAEPTERAPEQPSTGESPSTSVQLVPSSCGDRTADGLREVTEHPRTEQRTDTGTATASATAPSPDAAREPSDDGAGKRPLDVKAEIAAVARVLERFPHPIAGEAEQARAIAERNRRCAWATPSQLAALACAEVARSQTIWNWGIAIADRVRELALDEKAFDAARARHDAADANHAAAAESSPRATQQRAEPDRVDENELAAVVERLRASSLRVDRPELFARQIAIAIGACDFAATHEIAEVAIGVIEAERDRGRIVGPGLIVHRAKALAADEELFERALGDVDSSAAFARHEARRLEANARADAERAAEEAAAAARRLADAHAAHPDADSDEAALHALEVDELREEHASSVGSYAIALLQTGGPTTLQNARRALIAKCDRRLAERTTHAPIVFGPEIDEVWREIAAAAGPVPHDNRPPAELTEAQRLGRDAALAAIGRKCLDALPRTPMSPRPTADREPVPAATAPSVARIVRPLAVAPFRPRPNFGRSDVERAERADDEQEERARVASRRKGGESSIGDLVAELDLPLAAGGDA